MPTYAVTIQGTVSVTYDVEADDKETATEKAHNLFNNDPETFSVYGQETVDVRIVEPEPKPEPEPKNPPISKNLRLIEQALGVLKFWVDGEDQTDRDICKWAFEALEELKKQERGLDAAIDRAALAHEAATNRD